MTTRYCGEVLVPARDVHPAHPWVVWGEGAENEHYACPGYRERSYLQQVQALDVASIGLEAAREHVMSLAKHEMVRYAEEHGYDLEEVNARWEFRLTAYGVPKPLAQCHHPDCEGSREPLSHKFMTVDPDKPVLYHPSCCGGMLMGQPCAAPSHRLSMDETDG